MSLDQSQYSLNFWLNVRSRLFDKHFVTLLSAFDIMASAEATHWSKCQGTDLYADILWPRNNVLNLGLTFWPWPSQNIGLTSAAEHWP